MLLIQKNENPHLPKEYHRINDVCAVVYDQLTDLLANPKYYPGLKKTPFSINPDEHQFIEDLNNGNIHVLDWLTQNKLDDKVITVLTKHIALSVVSDFVNFVYESLNCAKKGKMTVAYSLLRKPFTDELLILEQLLSDGKDFIQKIFHDGAPEKYDPSSRKIKNNKIEIIKMAFQKLSMGKILSPDLIYKIRYDKSVTNGLNGITNKALHIVTTDENYKTLPTDLNFIFAVGPEQYQKHCKHYYHIVPLMLIYSAAVVDEILFQYLPETDHQNNKLIRAFKRFMALCYLDFNNEGESTIESMAEIMQYECDCGHIANMTKESFETFFYTDEFICEKCFKPIEMSADFLDLLKLLMLKLDETDN